MPRTSAIPKKGHFENKPFIYLFIHSFIHSFIQSVEVSFYPWVWPLSVLTGSFPNSKSRLVTPTWLTKGSKSLPDPRLRILKYTRYTWRNTIRYDQRLQSVWGVCGRGCGVRNHRNFGVLGLTPSPDFKRIFCYWSHVLICYYIQVVSMEGRRGELTPLKLIQLYSICILST